MKHTSLVLVALVVLGSGAAVSDQLPARSPKRIITPPKQGWSYFFGSCSWYCGAPRIVVSATSNLEERNGLRHPAHQAHDRKIGKVWSEAAEGAGRGESLTFTFHTMKEDTADLGVTSCAIAIGHQGSEKLFQQNGRPKKIELSIDGEATAVLDLKDVMGLQQFEIPKLALARPSTHSITLRILEVYPGTRFADTCISEVYFQGTGKMH